MVSARLERWVVIRAGHAHRGVVHDGMTPYLATAEEVELLRAFSAIVGED